MELWYDSRSKTVDLEDHECSKLSKSYVQARHRLLSAGSRLQTKMCDVTLSGQYFQEGLNRAEPAGRSYGSEGPSREVAVVLTFDGRFVVCFETISGKIFSIASFALPKG